MHRDYLNLLLKFYEKIVKPQKHAQLFQHALQRCLNFQFKQDEKLTKNRSKEEQDFTSMRSVSSNKSTDSFGKIKKLFYSNQIETVILFYFMFNTLKVKEVQLLYKLTTKMVDKVKIIQKGLNYEEKRIFLNKANKLIEHFKLLQNRINQECSIEWLFLQVFKQFQSEATLSCQILCSQAEKLQSREHMKIVQYDQLLRILNTKCYIADTANKTIKTYGSGRGTLYIGYRGETYFIITSKQFEKSQSNFTSTNKKTETPAMKQDDQKLNKAKQLKKYSMNKFKQQFLTEISKLKESYQINTGIISNLFNFKDAVNVPRFNDQNNQA